MGALFPVPTGSEGFFRSKTLSNLNGENVAQVTQDRTLMRWVKSTSPTPGSVRSQTEAAHLPAEGLVTLSFLVFQVSPGEGWAELQVIQVGPIPIVGILC